MNNVDLKIDHVDLLILNFPFSPTLSVPSPDGEDAKPTE
jgi:hypothetical protein